MLSSEFRSVVADIAADIDCKFASAFQEALKEGYLLLYGCRLTCTPDCPRL
jgi:hypothetical protein